MFQRKKVRKTQACLVAYLPSYPGASAAAATDALLGEELHANSPKTEARHGLIDICACCRISRKLFGDDEAVRKGLLQVYVRVKPVARKLVRCMAIEKEGLVKATW